MAGVPAPDGNPQAQVYSSPEQIQTAEHGKHLLAVNVNAVEIRQPKHQLDAIGVALEQDSIQPHTYRLTLQALGMIQKQKRFTPQ